jgi:hypothetical protein
VAIFATRSNPATVSGIFAAKKSDTACSITELAL